VTAVTAAITRCRVAVIAVFVGVELPISARNVDARIDARAAVTGETAVTPATRAALFGARTAIGATLARASLAHAALARAAFSR
jgi:hypothetical protein